MSDPNNATVQMIKYGGEDALQHLYQSDIWQSIHEKKEIAERMCYTQQQSDLENTFLNLLNEQEYKEFMTNRLLYEDKNEAKKYF